MNGLPAGDSKTWDTCFVLTVLNTKQENTRIYVLLVPEIPYFLVRPLFWTSSTTKRCCTFCQTNLYCFMNSRDTNSDIFIQSKSRWRANSKYFLPQICFPKRDGNYGNNRNEPCHHGIWPEPGGKYCGSSHPGYMRTVG